MAKGERTMNDLACTGQINELETRWLEALEDADRYRDDLLEALDTLNRNGRADLAATLGLTWLASEQEKSSPAEQLATGREVLARCKDSEALRQQVLRLYNEVHADRPGIGRLIDLSGLAGGKTARRALRTLEIALNIEVGDYLISRADEHAAKVTEVDPETCTYTVCPANDMKILDADELALAYDPVEENDFRVLVQLLPDRLAELLETDPATIVIGVLQSHHGQLDSDELAHVLSPRYIPANRWHTWWTKAKTALKRCPNIVIEGKARTILTYHADDQSLEDEILPQWKDANVSARRMAVIETYFREGRTRGTRPKTAMIQRMYDDLMSRVNMTRKGSPAEALAEALIIDRLAEEADLPDGAEFPVGDILNETSDPVALLRHLDDKAIYLRAIRHLKEDRPDDWPVLYARLLPLAPLEACETIARALDQAGQRERLLEGAALVVTDFTHHLDAVCWLWRGSSVEGLQPISPREMLLEMLNHLAELPRRDSTPAAVLRDARLKIRSALSAAGYKRFRDVIEAMESGLASTVHRTIDRLDGLGQVVHARLLRIIIETHPELIKPVEQVDPWLDDDIIFCTQAGLDRQRKEIEHLEKIKIPENAKAIGEAASHGDLSENSEYKFALEERDLLQARLMRMKNDLALARRLTADDVDTDEVNVGTRVTLKPVDGSTECDVTVLGPWEADMDRRIYNYRAPLCMKLRQLRIDDTVELDLGDGERLYRVGAIANAL